MGGLWSTYGPEGKGVHGLGAETLQDGDCLEDLDIDGA